MLPVGAYKTWNKCFSKGSGDCLLPADLKLCLSLDESMEKQ